MLRNVFTIFILFSLLLATNIASANSTSEDLSFNVTPLNKILQIEDGFVVTSTEWSPDGQYLLVTCSKMNSPLNYIVKHYLLDTNSHTFGEINYGINGSDTNGILQAKWTPSGDKIYFGVSRIEETNSGHCYIICNPDGTNLRCIGTNYTDLSYIIKNLGSIGFQRNLNWNQDSNKIVFEWEKPGNHSPGVYIADGKGTIISELLSATYPQPALYDSDKVFIVKDEGTVVLANDEGDLIQTFQPENKDERYCAFSLSPNRKKIMFAVGSSDSYNLQTYVSNIDGSNLKGNISYNENLWANESWQPNGSLLLVNQNRNLYIVEGDENNKRLLYKGNASESQWFPDGKKILFVENGNKLYSIDIDGTNLSFITSFGPTYSYTWKYFNEGQHFSISPSGNTIAFMSAFDSSTGKMIEDNNIFNIEIAAPLFIINSNGSNLTQVTPAVKGIFDTCINWSPDGKQFTIGSTKYSNGHGNSSLVKLDTKNSSSTWKSLPVKSEESGIVDKVQINEPYPKNTSQIAESQEIIKQSPSFMFIQPFVCIIGIWLLHKSRDM
ncbi:Periplasmic component of the Tol biopolymer transport system [Methanosarcina barkeri str. Wiesmoor]|uniref:Periplasmic component of the Tol biopolymer transport system n=2 Tax=Methanosarcina barkeri TaxID=2208 RepID=A0A0E3LL43_METBA|nr:TolB family protein [Methanosarcina barkeri]AKB50621.1 Periplasmic component of the Tol biopolymer transport system [Methanosarcina barkeri str. Wiesmoor]